MIQITKEIKKELLENYEIQILTENPLSFKDPDNCIYTGLPAEIILNKIIADIINDNEIDNSLSNIDIKTIDVDKYYLLTFNGNYADEFDMSEFTIMNGYSVINFTDGLKSHDEEFEVYFGTNEELIFDDGNDLLSQITIKEITEEEYDVLDKLFGGSFGEAGVFDYVIDMATEIDEDEDYDVSYKQIKDNQIKELKSKLSNYDWTMLEIDDENFIFKYSNLNGEVGFGDIELGKDLVKNLSKK